MSHAECESAPSGGEQASCFCESKAQRHIGIQAWPDGTGREQLPRPQL